MRKSKHFLLFILPVLCVAMFSRVYVIQTTVKYKYTSSLFTDHNFSPRVTSYNNVIKTLHSNSHETDTRYDYENKNGVTRTIRHKNEMYCVT